MKYIISKESIEREIARRAQEREKRKAQFKIMRPNQDLEKEKNEQTDKSGQ